MNEIEGCFYKELSRIFSNHLEIIEHHKVIGPYQVDFFINFIWFGAVIEIDGHEYHKTKEQRDYDYKRERYLMKKGYWVIRFTGTEIFLDSEMCVKEIIDITEVFINKATKSFQKGVKQGQKDIKKELQGVS